MEISYQSACGRAITTRPERAGKLEKCPSCRMSNLVPDGPEADHEKDKAVARGVPDRAEG